MPRFGELSKELQLKMRQMEHLANTEGKDDPDCKQLWRELGKSEIACFALGQKDGIYSVCTKAPTEHSLELHKRPRCGTHGGRVPHHDTLPEESKLAKIKHLRPDAHMIHGLYAEKSNFVESLTEGELQFMAWLENNVREKYEVEEGLGDVMLEGLLHDAVIHFRMVNTGRLEKASKHTAKPLMDMMKTIKEMGWNKKASNPQNQSQEVLNKWLDKLDGLDSSGNQESTKAEKPLN
ncbi:hypothetical protein M1K46_08005 [Fictibacillus sp. WQ 8-8]|uniref:hypothetical protein n=1 Tax=Fictibacillus sp. WQ 8-8 TaxID=2938788 RepID=UPI00210DA036|nr:hypothetical protein [Fictibacillus sp. WQ 8-8]MCQ6265606.1 hypothetical protein [Fictibacillus sp. WQ 8-8]